MTTVGSWNEWDALEEIVVGSATNAAYEPAEPGSRPSVRRSQGPFPTGPKPQHVIDAANRELDGLAQLLTDRGVTVRRPRIMDFNQPIRTPYFSAPNQYCSVCPRDVLITVGNIVLEAPMSRRARYFEIEAYRDIITDYWKSSSDFEWIVAPKPTMSDGMYREDFWSLDLEERYKRMHSAEFCVTQDEIVFDAADITRMGIDLFVQESMTTNRPGIDWLRRTLEPRGFRVHRVNFPLDLFPSHIDCTFVPLRPGLVLTNPDRPIRKSQKEIFSQNGWVLVDAVRPVLANDEMPAHCQSSHWLSMNVLSIDAKTVICEENEHPLIEQLSDLGFDVITTPFRNVFEFGGSLHCATWDVRRLGAAQDLFPNFDETRVE